MSSEILEDVKAMRSGGEHITGSSTTSVSVTQASLPSSSGNPQTGSAAREGEAGSSMGGNETAGQRYEHHNGGIHPTVKPELFPKTEDIDYLFQPQQTAESSAMGAARLAAEDRKDTVKHEHTDTMDFLKFQTEDDKAQVKLDEEEENDSKSASPDLRDEDDEEQEEEEDAKPKVKPGLPRSIADLPVAEAEAMKTFEELTFSTYQHKGMGRAHQAEESMQCECHYVPGQSDPDDACGENCINRLTQVECMSGDCRCKDHCRNQRFQRRQYGPIEIVMTEKKGFGMRAKQNIRRETFIYEYVGDVIGEKKFQQRIKEYYDEGIEHFYFMMLQTGEFIDATKRGGKGRFLNHSCAPNCYVAKWVVGKKIRMGIFAKRDILANEELTFNYNVDRYGHDAQVCYCGESNCVGFIGGKTQTDIGAMDELYLDALGITDDVEKLGLRGTKKKKSRKLDVDFIPTLTPISLEDVPKVASAVRQATSIRRILTKLLERILMTEDAKVQMQIMRLHGFSAMSGIMYEYPADNEILLSVLSVLKKWPLITRNKLMSTKIEDNIVALSEKEDESLSTPAKELLEMWQALEIGYRIPKSMRDAMESGDDNRKREAEIAVEQLFAKRARIEQEHANDAMALPAFVKPDALKEPSPFVKKNVKLVKSFLPAPAGWTLSPILPDSDGYPTKAMYICTATKAVFDHYPTYEEIESEAEKHRQAMNISVSDIIARTRAEAEAKAAKEAADAAAAAEAEARIKAEKRQAKETAIKEKKMYRLFSTLVVKTMSKYKKYLESEQFKRRAKEVCEIMCQKEKKSSHFATDTYDSLTMEREAKLAKYVKEFVQKLLARKGIKPSSSSSSSRSHSKGHHHSSSSASQSKHRSSQSGSGHSSSAASKLVEGGSATPDTPSSVTASKDAELEDMDIEGDDDDLINELVQDATGGSATPDSAKTPQSSHLETPFQSDAKIAQTAQ